MQMTRHSREKLTCDTYIKIVAPFKAAVHWKGSWKYPHAFQGYGDVFVLDLGAVYTSMFVKIYLDIYYDVNFAACIFYFDTKRT